MILRGLEKFRANRLPRASGCNADFFHFFQGLVLSVREKPGGSTIDISVVDLGLSSAQIEYLEDQKATVANPDWEYGLSASSGFPIGFKALPARLHVRKYFPGYEVYFHIDADAWIQDWFAVELHIAGARKGVSRDAGDRSLGIWRAKLPASDVLFRDSRQEKPGGERTPLSLLSGLHSLAHAFQRSGLRRVSAVFLLQEMAWGRVLLFHRPFCDRSL